MKDRLSLSNIFFLFSARKNKLILPCFHKSCFSDEKLSVIIFCLLCQCFKGFIAWWTAILKIYLLAAQICTLLTKELNFNGRMPQWIYNTSHFETDFNRITSIFAQVFKPFKAKYPQGNFSRLSIFIALLKQ